MITALFPGKFQPPHLGHILTLMKLYEKYDKIIIGITEDKPEVLSQKERKEIFEAVLQHLSKFEVVLIKGTIEHSKSQDNLPEFDVCISGNKKVIDKIKSFGKKAGLIPRSGDYSGTEIRKCQMKK